MVKAASLASPHPTRRSDVLMLSTFTSPTYTSPSHYQAWSSLTSPVIAQQIVRHKLGMLQNTKITASRHATNWCKLTPTQKHDMVQCPCGKGQQDSYHVYCECDLFSRRIEKWFQDRHSPIPVQLQPVLQGMTPHQLVQFFFTLPSSASSPEVRQYVAMGATELASQIKQFDDKELAKSCLDFYMSLPCEVVAYDYTL